MYEQNSFSNCNDCCEQCCNPCDCCQCPAPPTSASLTLYKIDARTGMGLTGAVFELRCGITSVNRYFTDQQGYIHFTCLQPGNYTLTEIISPPGFQLNTHLYQITVLNNCTVLVDGQLTTQLVVPNYLQTQFTAVKQNSATGAPLAGAVFELREGTMVIGTTTSDSNGLVAFENILPGTYTLVETVVPPGFTATQTRYTVVVSEDGSITINNLPATGYILGNTPFASTPSITITTVDTQTQLPLAGAVFSLTSGIGTVLQKTTDSTGMVVFNNLAPGSYTLTETSAPVGYLPNTTVYQIFVTNNGSVTIDGIATSQLLVANIQTVD